MDLAEQAGIDIIKSPDVTGNVTAKVTDVPLEEALTNILGAHNFTYIATDNMIRVVPLSEIAMAREELVSKVYRITYADANEVAAAISQFVSEKGRVGINRGTNHIVVTDTEKKIKAVDRFIAELDRQTQQVLVEVKIYEITTNEGFDLGAAFRAARNTPLKTTDRVTTVTNSDGLVYPKTVTTTTTPGYTTVTTEQREGTGEDPQAFGWMEYTYEDVYPLDQDSVNDYIRRSYENRRETTTVETPEITTTETTETIAPFPHYIDQKRQYYTRRRRKPTIGGSFDTVRGGTLSFSLLDAVDIELALNMLRTQVEYKLLANPRILVLDNQTADFEIVREVPYREFQQVARQDPITYTAFKNIGVRLKVTPSVARGEMIKLHISPEFSVLVSQDANGVPTVDARRADTMALIKDGQTIAIGGLRKRQNSKEIAKVPVLGDIPLLGNLFRSETELVQVNELIVLITPKIITGPEMLSKLDATNTSGIPSAFRLTEEAQKPQAAAAEPAGAEMVTPRRTAPPRGKSPALSMELAYSYLKMERFELARQTLLAVLEREPTNHSAYQYLGYCYLKLGAVDRAVASYRKAVELDDGDWEAHKGLGVAYMLKARSDKDQALKARAVEHWRRSLQIKPDQPNSAVLAKMIKAYSN